MSTIGPSLLAARLLGLLSPSLKDSGPMTWGNSTPVDIPSYTDEELENIAINQSAEFSRQQGMNAAISIENNIDSNGIVEQLMQKNSTILGLSGQGANAFYNVNLVTTNLNSRSTPISLGQDVTAEPDGFRLYLIKPPKPPVKQLSGLMGSGVEMAGGFAETGGAKLQEGGDLLKNTTGISLPGMSNAGENGKKINEYAKELSNKLKSSGEAWDKSFDKYMSGYDKSSTGNAMYSVILPLPKELTDPHGHETDTLMMGVAPRLLAGLASGLSGVGGFSGMRKQNANEALGGFLGAVGGSVGNVIGGVASAAGQYAFDTMRARLGVGANPNAEILYAKPQNRQFQFSFIFYPKSRKESDEIRDFINRLKQHSYPLSIFEIGADGNASGQGQVYSYPGSVYFEFSGRYRGKLFRSLRPCIITSIQVDYAGGSQFQSFIDGTPNQIFVTVGLMESRLLDRNILFDEESNDKQSFEDPGFRDTIYGSGTFAGTAIQNFVQGNTSLTDLFNGTTTPDLLRRNP